MDLRKSYVEIFTEIGTCCEEFRSSVLVMMPNPTNNIFILSLLSMALLSMSWIGSYAQEKHDPGTPLQIKKAKGEIKLDGVIDEQDWLDAEVATDFYQNFPSDSSFAAFQTEARITFDESNIYVSFICYDDKINRCGSQAEFVYLL